MAYRTKNRRYCAFSIVYTRWRLYCRAVRDRYSPIVFDGLNLEASVDHYKPKPVMAWWSILGLGITTFTFLGVNMFLSGLHSYGEL